MLSVLTPTMKGREAELRRCKASVATLRIPHEHIVVLDDPPSGGPAAPIRKANRQAQYPWRLILPDDDELLPNGVEPLLDMAIKYDLDFVHGLQGEPVQNAGLNWRCTWPVDGATGGFIYHERLHPIAELPAESYWAGRTDERGGDYLLLIRWVTAGARSAFYPIHLLVHHPSTTATGGA